jgi:hypothetical protein
VLAGDRCGPRRFGVPLVVVTLLHRKGLSSI